MALENMQKLILIKPVNEAIPEQSSYAPRPTGLEGKRVGLLDNSKHNAGRFLEMVATILDAAVWFQQHRVAPQTLSLEAGGP